MMHLREATALLGAALCLAGCGHSPRTAPPQPQLVRGPAIGGPTCWKRLLHDWYDGEIDQTYRVECYELALQHLPSSPPMYSTVVDDLRHGLASAVGDVVSPQSSWPSVKEADARARRQAAQVVGSWKRRLVADRRATYRTRFASPGVTAFRARLARAARLYRFTTVRLRFLPSAHPAPLVIAQTRDRYGLSHALPAIERLLDHTARTADDRTGWDYQAFLFEAVDWRNVPFLVVFNDWTGPHAGGGQWASGAELLPFPHG